MPHRRWYESALLSVQPRGPLHVRRGRLHVERGEMGQGGGRIAEGSPTERVRDRGLKEKHGGCEVVLLVYVYVLSHDLSCYLLTVLTRSRESCP